MILIDIPPGKTGRPVIKVCIDKYEYPNKKGEIPYRNIPFTGAQGLCKKNGKRLCTVMEWQWACSGPEGLLYPYGPKMEEYKCNQDGARRLEPSGSRLECVGKFTVYDMTGNLSEWVTDSRGEALVMDDAKSQCQTVSPGMQGAAKPHIGFRCCLSN
jgi:formylglycine-generating enzyme required for sulfatase activity